MKSQQELNRDNIRLSFEKSEIESAASKTIKRLTQKFTILLAHMVKSWSLEGIEITKKVANDKHFFIEVNFPEPEFSNGRQWFQCVDMRFWDLFEVKDLGQCTEQDIRKFTGLSEWDDQVLVDQLQRVGLSSDLNLNEDGRKFDATL